MLAKAVKSRKQNDKLPKVIEDMFDLIICKDVTAPDCDGTGTDNMTCVLVELRGK